MAAADPTVRAFWKLVEQRLTRKEPDRKFVLTWKDHKDLHCEGRPRNGMLHVRTAEIEPRPDAVDAAMFSQRMPPKERSAFDSHTQKIRLRDEVRLNTVACAVHGPLANPGRNIHTYNVNIEYVLNPAELRDLLGDDWVQHLRSPTAPVSIRDAVDAASDAGLLSGGTPTTTSIDLGADEEDESENGEDGPPPLEVAPRGALQAFDRVVSTEQLLEDLDSAGWVFHPFQIAAYLAALRTKPFVILAGVSGTGKSQLPQLVAERTGGRCDRIAVRPDWTDSSEVLGYVDLTPSFRPGPLARIAREASEVGSKFRVALVDEMNLARVEQYFAEVLSAIEAPDGARSLLVLDLPASAQDWRGLALPRNLGIVGTVNMDESTHGFSRKVLDRAFTLELSEVRLDLWRRAGVLPAARAPWPAAAWVPDALRPADLPDDDARAVDQVVEHLSRANRVLSRAQLQIGYRTRDEVVLFVHHARQLGGTFRTREGDAADPLDLAIQMKLLPRIAGGSGGVSRVVYGLLAWAIGKSMGSLGEADERKIAQEVMTVWRAGRPDALSDSRFPRTAARLCLMAERLETDGFTAYWL